MIIQGYDVICDFEATNRYIDKYNEQFRNNGLGF